MPPTFLQSYGSTVVGLLQETSAELVVWNWSGSPDPRVHALGTDSVGDFVDGEFVPSLPLDKKRNWSAWPARRKCPATASTTAPRRGGRRSSTGGYTTSA